MTSLEESDFFEDFIFSFREFFSLQIIERCIEVEEFITREVLIEICIFWHKSYFIANIRIIDISFEDLHLSARRSHDAEDTLHRRRLSCTIGSKKSENFPFLEREVDIMKQCCFSDFFGEMVDLDNRSYHREF